MTDHDEAWGKITARWRRGRRLGLFHLLVVPVLVYLFSFPVTGWSPERWLIGGAPVGYFIVSFALWLVVFIHLL